MRKDIDIKNRVVNFYDVDTGTIEREIIGYLDKQMLVALHSVYFNNPNYVFLGRRVDQTTGAITISSYRKRTDQDKYATVIE